MLVNSLLPEAVVATPECPVPALWGGDFSVVEVFLARLVRAFSIRGVRLVVVLDDERMPVDKALRCDLAVADGEAAKSARVANEAFDARECMSLALEGGRLKTRWPRINVRRDRPAVEAALADMAAGLAEEELAPEEEGDIEEDDVDPASLEDGVASAPAETDPWLRARVELSRRLQEEQRHLLPTPRFIRTGVRRAAVAALRQLQVPLLSAVGDDDHAIATAARALQGRLGDRFIGVWASDTDYLVFEGVRSLWMAADVVFAATGWAAAGPLTPTGMPLRATEDTVEADGAAAGAGAVPAAAAGLHAAGAAWAGPGNVADADDVVMVLLARSASATAGLLGLEACPHLLPDCAFLAGCGTSEKWLPVLHELFDDGEGELAKLHWSPEAAVAWIRTHLCCCAAGVHAHAQVQGGVGAAGAVAPACVCSAAHGVAGASAKPRAVNLSAYIYQRAPEGAVEGIPDPSTVPPDCLTAWLLPQLQRLQQRGHLRVDAPPLARSRALLAAVAYTRAYYQLRLPTATAALAAATSQPGPDAEEASEAGPPLQRLQGLLRRSAPLVRADPQVAALLPAHPTPLSFCAAQALSLLPRPARMLLRHGSVRTELIIEAALPAAALSGDAAAWSMSSFAVALPLAAAHAGLCAAVREPAVGRSASPAPAGGRVRERAFALPRSLAPGPASANAGQAATDAEHPLLRPTVLVSCRAPETGLIEARMLPACPAIITGAAMGAESAAGHCGIPQALEESAGFVLPDVWRTPHAATVEATVEGSGELVAADLLQVHVACLPRAIRMRYLAWVADMPLHGTAQILPQDGAALAADDGCAPVWRLPAELLARPAPPDPRLLRGAGRNGLLLTSSDIAVLAARFLLGQTLHIATRHPVRRRLLHAMQPPVAAGAGAGRPAVAPGTIPASQWAAYKEDLSRLPSISEIACLLAAAAILQGGEADGTAGGAGVGDLPSLADPLSFPVPARPHIRAASVATWFVTAAEGLLSTADMLQLSGRTLSDESAVAAAASQLHGAVAHVGVAAAPAGIADPATSAADRIGDARGARHGSERLLLAASALLCGGDATRLPADLAANFCGALGLASHAVAAPTDATAHEVPFPADVTAAFDQTPCLSRVFSGRLFHHLAQTLGSTGYGFDPLGLSAAFCLHARGLLPGSEGKELGAAVASAAGAGRPIWRLRTDPFSDPANNTPASFAAEALSPDAAVFERPELLLPRAARELLAGSPTALSRFRNLIACLFSGLHAGRVLHDFACIRSVVDCLPPVIVQGEAIAAVLGAGAEDAPLGGLRIAGEPARDRQMQPPSALVCGFGTALAIAPQHDAIVKAAAAASFTLVVTSTGSGKTTQVPQYLLHHALWARCVHAEGRLPLGQHYRGPLPCVSGVRPPRIVCALPRVLSAKEAASRITDELRARWAPVFGDLGAGDFDARCVGFRAGGECTADLQVGNPSLITTASTAYLLHRLLGARLPPLEDDVEGEPWEVRQARAEDLPALDPAADNGFGPGYDQYGGAVDNALNVLGLSALIIDELHERSIETELLLVVVTRLVAEDAASRLCLMLRLLEADVVPLLRTAYSSLCGTRAAAAEGLPRSALTWPPSSAAVHKALGVQRRDLCSALHRIALVWANRPRVICMSATYNAAALEERVRATLGQLVRRFESALAEMLLSPATEPAVPPGVGAGAPAATVDALAPVTLLQYLQLPDHTHAGTAATSGFQLTRFTFARMEGSSPFPLHLNEQLSLVALVAGSVNVPAIYGAGSPFPPVHLYLEDLSPAASKTPAVMHLDGGAAADAYAQEQRALVGNAQEHEARFSCAAAHAALSGFFSEAAQRLPLADAATDATSEAERLGLKPRHLQLPIRHLAGQSELAASLALHRTLAAQLAKTHPTALLLTEAPLLPAVHESDGAIIFAAGESEVWSLEAGVLRAWQAAAASAVADSHLIPLLIDGDALAEALLSAGAAEGPAVDVPFLDVVGFAPADALIDRLGLPPWRQHVPAAALMQAGGDDLPRLWRLVGGEHAEPHINWAALKDAQRLMNPAAHGERFSIAALG